MISVREIVEGDRAFLWDMLFECVHFPNEAHKPDKEEFLKQPWISKYLEGFGTKASDAGYVAHDENNKLLGAAWYRLFDPSNRGYGYIDANTPELSMALWKEHRGRGIGTILLGELIDRARKEGHKALTLSVDPDNPALRLYEREGFKMVEVAGTSWTMKLEL